MDGEGGALNEKGGYCRGERGEDALKEKRGGVCAVFYRHVFKDLRLIQSIFKKQSLKSNQRRYSSMLVFFKGLYRQNFKCPQVLKVSPEV